jgi:glycosyltransferase involved in cell wall biosynthesis
MAGISVVIETKDEERNIRDFLESVKWADEIVVVDDESKNNIIEIWREYTDKIFINNAKGSFHKNKKPRYQESKWRVDSKP